MKIDLDFLETAAKVGVNLSSGIERQHTVRLKPDVLLALIERIRRLEIELARASGIARAKGETAYADDFMRVAQDREDFDAEIAAVLP